MSSKNHKVLFLSRGGDISGAQRQLLYLIEGLDKDKYTPHVLCTQAGHFRKELEALDVRCDVRSLAGWRKGKHFFSRYGDVRYVSNLVRNEGVSLVHCSDVWLNEYMLRGIGDASIPSVLHMRAPLTPGQVRKHHCRKATRLVAISKRVQMRLAQITEIPAHKIVLIHDAVDEQIFKPMDRNADGNVLRQHYVTGDKVLVGMVGRVERGKDPFNFVRIARDVLKTTERAAFFVIGHIKDRAYYAKIEKYLRIHGLLNHVHFTGRREDMPSVLAALDVLVSLSGGSVRYEAMMCGTTVLCAWSRRPEESYHIRHDETGLLVTEKTRSAVRKVLVDAIEHDDLRARLGGNAQAWAQKHLSHTQLVQETHDLYEQLLNHPS